MKRYTLLLLLSLFAALGCHAITAAKILSNAASKFSNSGSVSATYTFSSKNGGRSKGTIKVKGKQFRIETPQVMVCYNGTNQWEYIPSSKQCTVTSPTYQETAQINPYAILSTYKSSYKASTVKSSIKGTYAVRLTPVSSHSPISKATLYIKSSDWQPVRLDILDRSGNLTTILITGITLGAKFSDSTFIFDKKKHPDVELIDLR